MNYQRYFYGAPNAPTEWVTRRNRFTGKKYIDFERSAQKRYKEARKQGYRSRIDTIYGEYGLHYRDYNYRANYLLPNVVQLDTVTAPSQYSPNEDNQLFCHHQIASHKNLTADGLPINLLELDIDFTMESLTTLAYFPAIEFWLILCPDPYIDITPFNNKHENGKYFTTDEIYTKVNDKLTEMAGIKPNVITYNYLDENAPEYPYENATQIELYRYAIHRKAFSNLQLKRGMKKIKFKWHATKDQGDITLARNEALFVIIRGFPVTAHGSVGLGFYSSSSIKYTKN